jgi:hypothetical protein
MGCSANGVRPWRVAGTATYGFGASGRRRAWSGAGGCCRRRRWRHRWGRRDQARQQEAQNQQYQAAASQRQAEYKRALSACLTARGYTVQ